MLLFYWSDFCETFDIKGPQQSLSKNVFVIYVVSTNERGMNEFNASLQPYKRKYNEK